MKMPINVRLDQVAHMLDEGAVPAQIQQATGLSPGSVKSYSSLARKSHNPNAPLKRAGTGNYGVGRAVYQRLVDEASRRAISTRTLVETILTNTVKDDLFAAIIDE